MFVSEAKYNYKIVKKSTVNLPVSSFRNHFKFSSVKSSLNQSNFCVLKSPSELQTLVRSFIH